MPFSLPAELHCHSNSHEAGKFIPDSLQTVENIVDSCVKKGIKILAITDHNSLLGYFQAKHYIESKNIDILLIPACEISVRGRGHILAYGVTQDIPKKRSARETIQLIHDQGGLAFAAHPLSVPYAMGKKTFHLDFDGIEGFNGPTPMFINFRANHLAKKHRLPAIAGSDSHEASSLGHGLTYFPSTVRSVEDCLEHLKNGNFSIQFTSISRAIFLFGHLKAIVKNTLEILGRRAQAATHPIYLETQEPVYEPKA